MRWDMDGWVFNTVALLAFMCVGYVALTAVR